MNKTISPRETIRRGFVRYAFITSTLLIAASLPTVASAAPEYPSLTELAAIRVPLPWTATLGAALLIFAIATLALWIRLRRRDALGRADVAALRNDNGQLLRQLRSSHSECASGEARLKVARKELEQQRQDNADLLAVVGHRLRQPLDTLHSTLKMLARSGIATELVQAAQRQQKAAIQALEEIQRAGSLETVELKLPATATSLSILLVENGLRESLRAALEARGHRLHLKNNGVDAVSAALNQRFDLVLIDSQLPLMDGVEAVRKIRREAGAKLPIFALLTETAPGDRERYRARGFTGVLARPVRERQLQQLLDWAEQRGGTGGDAAAARPTRMVNSDTLSRKHSDLGAQSFAELLGNRIATLPKKITVLTSTLTKRHWLDAREQAQALAASAGEVGLEAMAARLRALAARLANAAEREYCRHQRTELLNLMRESVQQLKAWREQHSHGGFALT